MDSTIVRSAIFSYRNSEKTENGEIGRAAVALGQAKKVVDYISTLDNKVGKQTSGALEALKSAAKTDSTLKLAGKVIDFSSKNINPLICFSSAIDVARSDNTEEALIVNTTALATMFGTEHLMKNHLESIFTQAGAGIMKAKGKSELVDKAVTSLSKMKYAGKISPIAQGVAFVVGSCTAYGVGEKFGKLLVNGVKKEKTEPVNQQTNV